MKDYYIESRNSMGYVLMHVGKYSSYKDFRKSVNAHINSLSTDNYYREFKIYPKVIQYILRPLSFFGMRIKVKTFDSMNKIDTSKYYCRITELYRNEESKRKYLEVA